MEHAEFGGNLYGTTAKAVDDVSKGEVEVEGQDGKVRRRALLDIDAQVSFDGLMKNQDV